MYLRTAREALSPFSTLTAHTVVSNSCGRSASFISPPSVLLYTVLWLGVVESDCRKGLIVGLE